MSTEFSTNLPNQISFLNIEVKLRAILHDIWIDGSLFTISSLACPWEIYSGMGPR